MELAVP